MLRNTPFLRLFSADYNRISSIDSSLFEPCINLEEVNLQKNRITALQTGTFRVNKRLTRLNIWSNNITVVSSEAFPSSVNLTVRYPFLRIRLLLMNLGAAMMKSAIITVVLTRVVPEMSAQFRLEF